MVFIEAGSVGWSDYRTVFALIVGLIFYYPVCYSRKRIERSLLPLSSI